MCVLAVFLIAGCGGDDDEKAAGDFAPADFKGGNFQMTTTAVVDGCTDKALEAVFMPEGKPNAWAVVTELPSHSALPKSYEVTAPDPYGKMMVNAVVDESIAGAIKFADAKSDGTEVDAEAYPGCVADVTVSGSLTIVDADTVSGSITLNSANWRDEDGEDSCPVLTADPCDITLDLTATRAQ